MNEREIQAHEYLRRKEWIRAHEIFDQILCQGIHSFIQLIILRTIHFCHP